MKLKTKTLNTAMAAIIGAAGMAIPLTSSAIIPDGHYRMVVNDTPYSGGFDFGADGSWNSSFTFGCLPRTKGCNSQGMYDNGTGLNGVVVHPTGSQFGSDIPLDGVSGVIDITVSGGTFTVDTYSKDVTLKTAGGAFFQSLPASGTTLMSGTISGTQMTLDPTGRLGSIDTPIMLNRAWNIDDCGAFQCGAPNGNTTYNILTTASAYNSTGTVNGTPLNNEGDITGSAPTGLGFSADGRDDFSVTLVTGGFIGSAWGDPAPGFYGAQYFEIWNMTIYSLIKANDDVVAANVGVTETIDLTGAGSNDTTPFPPLVLDTVPAASTLGGIITNNGDGTVDYTPPVGAGAPAAPFTDTFTYTISDNAAGNPLSPASYTDTAKVTISVISLADPSASGDAGITNQNTAVTIDVTANDSSADTVPAGTIDPATVAVTTPASNGGTSVDAVTGVVTYTPATDFVGTDTFQYTVDNSNGFTSNAATVTVTVNAAAVSSVGSVAPGAAAIAAGSADGKITAADVPVDSEVDQQCVGGCFDIVINGLAPGQQIDLFLPPLTSPIPTVDPLVFGDPQYRKNQGGEWVVFDLANVASAQLNAFGACSSNPADYTQGLNPGDSCLKLTLTEGSLAGGDADGIADGILMDPGGIALPASSQTIPALPSRSDFSNVGGCSVSNQPVHAFERGDWWLVAVGLLVLSGLRKRCKPTIT